MLERKEIIDTIISISDSFGLSNKKRIGDYCVKLSRCNKEDVYYGITSFLRKKAKDDIENNRQELAGRLLYLLRPKIELDYFSELVIFIKNIDPSIEEVPYFFLEILGKENLSVLLDKCKGISLSKHECENVESFEFWISKYDDWIKNEEKYFEWTDK